MNYFSIKEWINSVNTSLVRRCARPLCQKKKKKQKKKQQQHRLMEQIIENIVAYTERMKI